MSTPEIERAGMKLLKEHFPNDNLNYTYWDCDGSSVCLDGYFDLNDLADKIDTLLTTHDAELWEKILAPFCFLQAEFTTLLLERNTYNREAEIQKTLESIQEYVQEIITLLTPKK